MSYENAAITKKANIYYDGQVTSRSVTTAEGEKITLGIMLPGSYNFGTGAPELMEVTQGSCRVKLAGSDEWNSYGAGESFNVPGNSNFDIEVVEVMDYICHFE